MVEDELRDFNLVAQSLQVDGLNCALNRVDSKEGYIRALEEDRPDVILSDHGLPSMDGFSALSIARGLAPDTPFIFVSGALGDERTVDALKNGAADFVLKHRLHALPAAIRRALQQREQALRERRAEEEILRLNAELEQRVAERTAELEAANKELEAFSYSVSHDLRAPLRHIEGFIEILRSTKVDQLDEESQHYLQTISQAATQMGRLIDDLLALSRTARAELRKIPVALGELLSSTIADVKQDLEGRRIEWVVGTLPPVHADPALLRQVLLNLICNALKYTRPRPLARIEIGARSSAKEHIIWVRDNGVGFDMRYAHKLFGVFQRLHRAVDFEGTGIGLANVRRIIHRHGGRTWAEGEVDCGAAFYFSLPVEAGAH